MGDPVQVFHAGERPERPTTQTPGMRRDELLSLPDSWAGFARAPAGSVTGWHHHAEYNSYIYTISGRIRLEFGPDGGESVEGGAGDVFFVPKGVVHRETALGPDEAVAFLVRVGAGEPVVNVEGPEG
jgi:uncharacterized RmlC-like cupin family protein